MIHEVAPAPGCAYPPVTSNSLIFYKLKPSFVILQTGFVIFTGLNSSVMILWIQWLFYINSKFVRMFVSYFSQ